MIGAIEAGGTKIMLAIGTSPSDLRAVTRIPTTDPTTTIAAIIAYFEARPEPLQAIGIGSFGPIAVERGAADWGHILNTTKPGWRNTDLAGPLGARFGVPIGLDTDVNAAAIAEQRWGAGADADPLLYVTVGTGVGGGAIVNGRPIHGLLHPEMGHLRVQRHPADDRPGGCPFHRDCLEGLASGPAIERGFGQSLDRLGLDSVAGEIIADYLGQACALWVMTMSPQRIILGGGVMGVAGLRAAVADRMHHWIGGYIQSSRLSANDYIRVPQFGDLAGLAGALALGLDAASA